MTILCLPRPRAWRFKFLKTCAAARPSCSAVSAVIGSTFAVPRTPSVPKIFLLMAAWEGNGDLRWVNVYQRGAGRQGDFDIAQQIARRAKSCQIDDGVNLAGLQMIYNFRRAN